MKEIKRFEFTGELIKGPTGMYYVPFPYDAFTEFGTRKAIRIKVWFEDEPERKSLLPRADGTHCVSISYPVRTRLGLSDGDLFRVVIEEDPEQRTVTLPEDVEWLLDNEPDLKTVFLKQSWSNQKFFINWITQASAPEVRVNRINRIFEWLEQHKRSKVKVLKVKEKDMQKK